MLGLSWDDAGIGTPVVLLHGLTAARHYVVMGSKALERSGHRVVAYDARGHGRSEPATDGYSYEQLAADLGALMDELGIERAVLAGASMGAHTIIRFTLDSPQRVAAAVLVTPAFQPDRDPGLARWDALSDGLRASGVEGFVAAYDVDAVPEVWSENIVTVLRQRLAAHEHLDAVADALREVPRSRPFEAMSDLSRLAGCPVTVVGSRDDADPEHPLAVAEAYVATIKGAQLVVEGSGRSPIAWQGGQLSRVIAETAARI